MKIITNNPYRTIGLLANCTEKDIQRQKGLIKRFMDVEKDIVFDTDITLPINCDRDRDSISAAFAKIEQVKSRVANGLFWFINANHIDEPAIDYLKDGNSAKASEIWSKTTTNSDNSITAKNCSAVHNLSTLKLGLAFYDKSIDRLLLSEGILLKAKLLNSDFVFDVLRRISDETYQPNKEELNRIFAEELLSNISPFLDKPNGIPSSQFISIVVQTPDTLKKIISKKFIDKPLHSIETKIEETEGKRKENKSNAYKLGTELYNHSKSNLELLEAFIGNNSLQYTLLADKVAEELLRCSTDYFNELRDSKNDPGENALKLTKFGNSIACGSKIKVKIDDDIKFLQKWISEKPQRDKEKSIEVDLDFIIAALKEFDNREEIIENAKALVNRCKPKLQSIRTTLGSNDDLYLKWSSIVGSDAQQMIIKEINETQKKLIKKVEATHFAHEKKIYLDLLKVKFKEAWDASSLIGTLDMNQNFRIKFNENKNTLQELCNQMGVSTSTYSPQQSSHSTRQTNTPPNNDGIPSWVFWVGGIILLIILANAC